MLELQFDPFPVIFTERLQLREITDADCDALFLIRSSPEVMRYIDRPKPKSAEDIRVLISMFAESLKNRSGITWGISLKDNSAELIGTIGYWRIVKEHYRAEIGYLLHPDQQQKGMMREALKSVIDYAFDTMQLHSIEANVNPLNQASIRLLENTGFVREAYFKENYFSNGRFLDSAIYSLVNTG